MYCVYLMAPAPEGPCQIGFTCGLSQALGRTSGLATMQRVGYQVDLFGTLWFQYADQALAVTEAAHRALASRRGKGLWFDMPANRAYAAMLAAAEQVGAPYLDYEGYVDACRWRSELPLDRRLAVTRREVRAVGVRLAEAAELAAAAHGIFFSKKQK